MTYKILSLDGGGTWALIQVKALQKIFGAAVSGHAVLANFDMVVANSGGSIVLGGLLEDKPLDTILNYFMDEGLRRSIFQPTSDIGDQILEGLLQFGPRFSTQKKLPALQRLMPACGGKTLPQAAVGIAGANGQDVHLLIASFDYDRNIAAFFRSSPTGGPEWGDGAASDDVTVAQAIHASSDAPVQFFDAPATWGDGSNRYWDGAIAGCNNPVLAGVAEAITLGNQAADIRALAIGTGTVRWAGPPQDPPQPFYATRDSPSFTNDLKKLAGSITDDPPDVASFLAHVMAGGSVGLPAGAVSRIVRMNPIVGPVSDGDGGWEPPGNWTIEQLTHLAGVDLAALDPIDVSYIADYGDLWLSGNAPNQPIRMDANTLQSKLGATTYQAALAAWKQIT